METKLLESYPEYSPQNQYNNYFIKYLYNYLRDNTYAGRHSDLYRDLLELQQDKYKTVTVKENTDTQTFILTETDESGFTETFEQDLIIILQKYNNYRFLVKSVNRIVVKVNFGWLPNNAGSWLNLLNSEAIIDYYIDGVTLVPNTHRTYSGAPDSGYVCYKIDSVNEYDNIAFLIKDSQKFASDVRFTFASLLEELEGTKGATLNRIVTDIPQNTFYAVGPYKPNYISTEKSSLIIQVPYEYAISDSYYVFNVTNSVQINYKNSDKSTDKINFYVPFDISYYDKKTEEEYEELFTNYAFNKDNIVSLINADTDIFSTQMIQYFFGDFIWRTSDSKLIAYLQQLLNTILSLTDNKNMIANGVWSDTLSNYVIEYKKEKTELKQLATAYIDDVVDKITEELMISDYKIMTNNSDPNLLFCEW